MKRYSAERREAVLRKMMPPMNRPIAQLHRETGIPEATLYNWRMQAKQEGRVVPGDGKNPETWSSADKFAVVLETAAFNAAELAEYCRKKGLFVEQVTAWRKACEQANDDPRGQTNTLREEIKAERKRTRGLERELRRKEKALAETAALLTLRKKAAAIWGTEDEDE